MRDLDELRRQHAAAFAAARGRVLARVGGGASSAKELLAGSRRQARELLSRGANEAAASAPAAGLSLRDQHLLDKLLSHVRHSVVRVCFYNLKLFCPSLVDEYDASVRAQVLLNVGQFPQVREELEGFFAQPLEEGGTVGSHFAGLRDAALGALASLAAAGTHLTRDIDTAPARACFAGEAPGHIDGVMKALGEMQRALDGGKVSVGELVEESVALHGPALKSAGTVVDLDLTPCPKVFAAPRLLSAAFGELLMNTARHAGARLLHITVQPTSDKLAVEACFADDGRGMTAEELETCVLRGVSRDGTGEGLAMVLEAVEAEHLGTLAIESPEEGGCRVTVRLPVKLQTERSS